MPDRPSTPPRVPPTLHSAPTPVASPLAKRPKTEPPALLPTSNEAMSASTPAPPVTSTPVTDVSSSPPLLVKKLAPSAKAPTRGSAFAAGYDLYSAKDTVVPARGKALVDTELAIAVPAGTCEHDRCESHFRRIWSADRSLQMDGLPPEVVLRRRTSLTPALVSLMPTTEARSRSYCSIMPRQTSKVVDLLRSLLLCPALLRKLTVRQSKKAIELLN